MASMAAEKGAESLDERIARIKQQHSGKAPGEHSQNDREER